MEHRSHKGTVEVRQGLNGQPMIAGYAAVFNKPSSDMGFIEQVDPGAFTKTLQEADVRGLANHDANWTLGRVKSGTCRLSVDNVGLKYEIDINEQDPDGVRALQKVQRGDWDGSSFSFQTIQDQWDWSASPPQRRLLEVGLVDVGPVCFPAYPDATAAARALQPIADKRGLPVDKLVMALRTGEIRSLIDGPTLEQRLTWTTSYMNDLPDSSFLYIEDGGDKDSDGKTTPRSLRHLPYKNAQGAIDVPHLRAAISRLSQDATGNTDGDAWLTDSLKESLLKKAQGLLAEQKGANSLTFAGALDQLEERVGKSISAANAKKISDAIDQLRELIGGSTDDGDADDGTLLGQALEMDSIPMAKEMDSHTPTGMSFAAARAAVAERELRVLQDSIAA